MLNRLVRKILFKTLNIKNGEPILLNKVHFVMFPARSMAKLVQKWGDDFGDEFLYDLGYMGGEIVAKEFIEKLNWINKGVAHRLLDIFKMFEVMGFGKLDMKIWDIKRNRMLFHVENHPVIMHAFSLYGKNEKACSLYGGIFSAHANNELKLRNCYLKETQCIRNGSQFCEWSCNYFKTKK